MVFEKRLIDKGYIERVPEQAIKIRYGISRIFYRLDTGEKIDRYLIVFTDMSKVKSHRDMDRVVRQIGGLIKLFPHYKDHKQAFAYFLDVRADRWDEKPYMGKNTIVGSGRYGSFSNEAKEILDVVKEDQMIHVLQKKKESLKHEWVPKGYTFPLITYALIVINVFIWITHISQAVSFAVTADDFLSMNVKAFIASGFMHGSIFHLMGNMISLFIIGAALERETGHFQFGVIYMLCEVISMEGTAEMKWMLGETTGTVGASGAIFGLLGAYLVTQLLIPKEHRCDIGAFIGRLTVLTITGFITPGVDYKCHIWGFIVGVIVTLLYRYLGLVIRQTQYKKIGEKLAVYNEDFEIAGRLRV